MLFLQQGGLCVALKEECCFYTDKTGLVLDGIKRVEENLAKRKLEREKNESWYKNWFSTSPWLSTLLPSILGPFVGLLLLLSFGPWAFGCLTDFVKKQVDSVIMPVGIHYHRLAQEEESIVQLPPDSASIPPHPLNFSSLLPPTPKWKTWFHSSK